MKLSKALKIFGYSVVKLATMPVLLTPLHKYLNCYDNDISLLDILSLADFAGCEHRASLCSSGIGAEIFFGVVCLVFVEVAYLWLMYMELRKPPPIELKRGIGDSGIVVEWVDSYYNNSSAGPDLEFDF
eukprot:XP_019922690.1 PREDICTED: uncharacterized protein LOC109618725 [Crassostrea gigas]